MLLKQSLGTLTLLTLLSVSSAALSEKENCVQVSQPDGPNQVIVFEEGCLLVPRPDGLLKAGPPGALSNEPYTVFGQGNSVVVPQRNVVINQFDLLADPKIIALIAKFKRSLFEALIEEGFTEEQALKIVVSKRFPGAY
jgi:hypothetical protein